MAAEELLALLSPQDLAQFQGSVIQSSPSYMGSQAVQAWQPDMSTWSPMAQGAGSFGRSFLSSILGNMARQDAASQLQSVVGSLPQLRSDPQSVVAPEGVDPGAFEFLKGSAIVRKAQRDASISDDPSYQAKKFGIIEKMIENPQNVKRLEATMPNLLRNILGKDYPAGGIVTAPDDTGKPVVSPVAEIPTLESALLNGRPSTTDKEKSYAQQFMDAGYTPAQAAISARDKVKGEQSANNKSFDEAKEARSYGQNLLQLANTARAGMSKAGQTGPYNSMAKGYEYIADMFGSPEASQQIAGDTVLDSIAPDVIKLARPIGGGATSDFEARTYLGSGPSTKNTPEANNILVSKLENLGKLNIEYGDFLEAYRDANGGSTSGAAKLWSKYKESYPLFTKDGEINSSRPSWQDFFTQGSSASPVAPQYEIRTAPNGQKYKVILGR